MMPTKRNWQTFIGILVLSTISFAYAESAISATWESKIPVAHNIFAPRTGHTASVIGQQLEQIWVVGGNTKDINAPNLQQLDLNTMTWSVPVLSTPVGVGAGHSAVSFGDSLYIYGGGRPAAVGVDVSDRLYQFNVQTREVQDLGVGLPGPLQFHVAVKIDKRMFIFGGNDGYKDKNEFFVYDFVTGQWIKVSASGTSPSPRSGSCATAYDTGFIIYGGSNYDRDLSDLYFYDLNSNEWTLQESKYAFDTAGRPLGSEWARARASCAVAGNSFLVWGGRGGNQVFNDFLLYHLPPRGTSEIGWDQYSVSVRGSEFPDSRSGHTLIEIPAPDSGSDRTANFRFLLFGGEDSRGRQYNDFFQLDLLVEGLTTSSSRQQSALSSALASWSLRASISECDFCKLEGHSVSVFSDPNGSKQKSKLVVFGGQQKGILRQQYQADTYIYELDGLTSSTDSSFTKWKHISPGRTTPPPRAGHSLAMVPGTGLGLLFGGETPGFVSSTPTDEMFLLDIGKMTWSTLQADTSGGAPSARRHHTSVSFLSPDMTTQGVIIFGGDNKHQSFSDAYLLALVGKDSFMWTKIDTKGNLPDPRTRHCSVMDHSTGIMYAIGGEDIAKGTSFSDVFALRLEHTGNPMWELVRVSRSSSSPEPRHSHACQLITSEYGQKGIVIIGGVGSNGAPLSDAWFLNLETREWARVEADKVPRNTKSAFISSSAGSGDAGWLAVMIGNDKVITRMYPVARDSSSADSIPVQVPTPSVTAPKNNNSPTIPPVTPTAEPQRPNHPPEVREFLDALSKYQRQGESSMSLEMRARKLISQISELNSAIESNAATKSLKSARHCINHFIMRYFISNSRIQISSSIESLHPSPDKVTRIQELKALVDARIAELRRILEQIEKASVAIQQSSLAHDEIRMYQTEVSDLEGKLQGSLSSLSTAKSDLEQALGVHSASWTELRVLADQINSDALEKQVSEARSNLATQQAVRVDHLAKSLSADTELKKLLSAESSARASLTEHERKGNSAPSRIREIEADIALATNAIQEDDSFVAQRTKEVRVLKKNIAKLNRKIAAIRKKDQSVVELLKVVDERQKFREALKKSMEQKTALDKRAETILHDLSDGQTNEDLIDDDDELDDDDEFDDDDALLAGLSLTNDKALDLSQLEEADRNTKANAEKLRSELSHRLDILLKALAAAQASADRTLLEAQSAESRREASTINLSVLKAKLEQERSEHANWTEKKNALETSLADIETKITGKRNDINNFKSAIQEVDIVIANFKEDLAKKESGIKTSKADFVKKVGNLASQDKSLDNHVAASMRSVEQATSASGLYFSAFSRVEEKMTLVRKATQSLQQAWDSLSQDEAKLRVLSRIQELIMSGRFNEQQLNTAANAFQDSLSPATKPIEKALPA